MFFFGISLNVIVVIDVEVVCRLLVFVGFESASQFPSHMKALVRTLSTAELRALLQFMTGLQSLPAWLSSHPVDQPLPQSMRMLQVKAIEMFKVILHVSICGFLCVHLRVRVDVFVRL